MQEDLQRLARELRKETCPQRVINDALRQIAAETAHSPGRLRYAISVGLVASLLLGGLLIWWHVATVNSERQTQLVAQQSHRSTQAARQTETALAIIATVLRDVSTHSETVISDHAIPPLRNGLETAKNKIIRHTEL